MICIILADRFKKGSKSKGWSGLTQINKKSVLINNQINTLQKAFPNSKILYIYGFDHKKVEDFFENHSFKNVIPIYNKLHLECGETHSLSRSKNYLEEDALIIYGDIILKPTMFNGLNKKHSQLFLNKKQSSEIGCTINKEGKIEHICYDLENFLSNIYYFNKNSIHTLRAITSRKEHRNYFLFEIVNKMIDRGIDFYPIEFNKENFFKTVS